MVAKSNTQEFIKSANLKHGDKYDYSKTNYTLSNHKVAIICKTHGEFRQIPYSHLDGRGCLKCGIIQQADSNKSNTQEFIDKAILIHGEKYDYSKVDYTGNHNKVTIICRIHGEFRQTVSDHLRGKGCPSCGIIQRSDGKRSDTHKFIKSATLIHEDKYDYSKVDYTSAKSKVIIICRTHGEFRQIPNGHLDGNGCPNCASISTGNKLKSNTQEFVSRSILIHGDKYNYSEVDYTGSKNNVMIICKIHGEFQQCPTNHLNGSGCPECAIIERANNQKLNTQEFINRATSIHGDKYDYSQVDYIRNDDKVTIICKDHGEFRQIPNGHFNGKGCPECGGSISKSQRLISDYISSKGFEVIDNYKPEFMNGLHLDIFLPKLNIAIEYGGYIFHHSCDSHFIKPKAISYHYNKWLLCKKNNVTLLNIFDFQFETNREKYYKGLDRLLFGKYAVLDAQEPYIGDDIENDKLEYYWVKHISGSKFIFYSRKELQYGKANQIFNDYDSPEQIIMRNHQFLQIFTSRLINYI
jgi:hypothetical protein